MSTDELEPLVEDQEPVPEPPAEGEPGPEDVEGHSLMIDPAAATLLHRAREDEVKRQAEKHRREQEGRHPFQPRGRR